MAVVWLIILRRGCRLAASMYTSSFSLRSIRQSAYFSTQDGNMVVSGVHHMRGRLRRWDRNLPGTICQIAEHAGTGAASARMTGVGSLGPVETVLGPLEGKKKGTLMPTVRGPQKPASACTRNAHSDQSGIEAALTISEGLQ